MGFLPANQMKELLYILHNIPSAFTEVQVNEDKKEQKSLQNMKVYRIIKSIYELQKSAANWQWNDFMEA
jgi:hypothetical protein